ncbi:MULTISPECIES: hypothetical protein [unclassified Streptomyces]|uniref:hypothetical protein n=1 Tax=unclassified Streptomyces TaxID=2593676 RepID=UPI001BEBC381|nr:MULTISPECIES: hypothetical protein [unclassified Streptomyces]MBT2405769.1 hypothetical protein [Streptomyces sp. ISL-21]MBT2458887.1 hypothetical protein [Streptomyces sp. ISL-86]MBT2610335.1 hypothetical protein [Streptomyces sp. ISL-87]
MPRRAGPRRPATRLPPRGTHTAIGYLTAKAEFLRYDIALAADYPIATGIRVAAPLVAATCCPDMSTP